MIFGKHINRYYLIHLPKLLLGVVALIAVDYFQLLIPKLYRLVITGVGTGVVEIDGVTTAFDMNILLDEICAPLLVAIAAMVIGRFLWRWCFFGTSISVVTDLRVRMFDNCKNLPVSYYQNNKVGNLMSLFTNDLESIDESFGVAIMELFDILLLGGMAIWKMLRVNVTLTVLSLVPVAIMIVIGFLVGKIISAKWDARQAAFSDLSDFAQETFSGLSVIKAFVAEYKELLAFRELNKHSEQTNVDYTRISTLLDILILLLVDSIVCIIFGYGGYLIYYGKFDVGELIEFLGYFIAIIWPATAVFIFIETSSRGRASYTRISELLDAKSDVIDRPDATDIPTVNGKIEMRSLNFTYPGASIPSLIGADFVINAGENVGIIGKTGSGKTTIADLILRVYNVPNGTLYIDDKDVNDITIDSLRKAMAYVPQDNFLFSDTIEGNISFAVDDSDPKDVRRAAELSDVAADIDGFAGGFSTVLGERGVTVSGGQKQRISIARALMKDAPILILDDSVSAVDTDTERSILNSLRTTRRGKTTILIAHRVSTIRDMDKIIYLDSGRVLDVGTHDELYARCSEYRTTVDLQKLEDEHKEANNA